MQGRFPEHLIFNFRQRSHALTTLLRFCVLTCCRLSGSIITLGGFEATFTFCDPAKVEFAPWAVLFGSELGRISSFTLGWEASVVRAPEDAVLVTFLGWTLASAGSWLMLALALLLSAPFIEDSASPFTNCRLISSLLLLSLSLTLLFSILLLLPLLVSCASFLFGMVEGGKSTKRTHTSSYSSSDGLKLVLDVSGDQKRGLGGRCILSCDAADACTRYTHTLALPIHQLRQFLWQPKKTCRPPTCTSS